MAGAPSFGTTVSKHGICLHREWTSEAEHSAGQKPATLQIVTIVGF